jgi:endonuclease YncB( thermonuclease family)
VAKTIRFWPERRRSPLRRLAVAARPFVLLAVLAGLWVAYDPALVDPPALLSSDPEQVDDQFTRCGPGRGHACVIDGDTFKLGSRKVRIIGIDAPEVHGQCAEEMRLAETATAKLQDLLNEGPFEMVAPIVRGHDQYGRDLRALRRTRADGSMQSIADDMRSSGLAHRYAGFKIGWC